MTQHIQTLSPEEPGYKDGGCLTCDECDKPEGHFGSCDCVCGDD